MTSPAPALGPILGAIEIGVLISSVLYGVTCVQTYLYASARASENDRSIFKLLVAAIWCAAGCRGPFRVLTVSPCAGSSRPATWSVVPRLARSLPTHRRRTGLHLVVPLRLVRVPPGRGPLPAERAVELRCVRHLPRPDRAHRPGTAPRLPRGAPLTHRRPSSTTASTRCRRSSGSPCPRGSSPCCAW
jgi:hypothetical protein